MMVYQAGEALCLHLVNYAYDLQSHDFVPQADIQVSLTLPEGMEPDARRLELLRPDDYALALDFQVVGRTLVFSVPALTGYALAVFK